MPRDRKPGFAEGFDAPQRFGARTAELRLEQAQQFLPARGARTLGVRRWGGELPEGRQKADGTVRLAVVTTQGVIALALAVRVRA